MTEYSDGEVLFAADMDNVIESIARNGVLTTLGVTENTPTPDMNVITAAGSGFAGETFFLKGTGTTVPITVAHASLDRIDLIVVNSSGTISAIAGTPAATPNPPDLPDDSIDLAFVDVAATVTQIFTADITDKRLWLGSIQKEMVDSSIAVLSQAEVVTGAWNFQENIKLESGKALEFCATGDTVMGTIYGTATNLRFTADCILGSGLSFIFGDGVDICGEIFANIGYFVIEDVDGNTVLQAKANEGTAFGTEGTSFVFQSTAQTVCQLIIATNPSTGGVFPDGSEEGGSGGTNNQWQAVWSKFIYTSGGAHGSYSQRSDLADLRAIKEYRDEAGLPLKTTEHGDPVWDTRTIPEYLRDKESMAFRSKRQTIKSNIPTERSFSKRKLPPKPDKILEPAPEMAYLNVSYVQGWFISLFKKLDAEIQEIKAALVK